MYNLTTLQIKYIETSFIKNIETKLETLKFILETLNSNNNLRHDNKNKYVLEANNYYIKSNNNLITLNVSGANYETYLKWSYNTLKSRVEDDLYFVRYKELQQKLAKLHYTKIRNNWINGEQYGVIRKAYKGLNFDYNCNFVAKKDNQGNYFAMLNDDSEYTGIKEVDGTITYIIKTELFTRREILKDKTDLNVIEQLINQIRKFEFIKPIFIVIEGKDDKITTKHLLTEIIDNFNKSQEYFKFNILPKLNNKENINYYLV